MEKTCERCKWLVQYVWHGEIKGYCREHGIDVPYKIQRCSEFEEHREGGKK